MAVSAQSCLHLLLVEDSEDDAFFFRRALESSRLNYCLAHVNNGAEAITYLQGRAPYSDRTMCPFPDIMVTDLKMPRTDGFDILRWLKDHPACSVIPTIVLSSSFQESDVVTAYGLGANAFIAKPANYTDLGQILIALHMFWSLCQRPPPPKSMKCD